MTTDELREQERKDRMYLAQHVDARVLGILRRKFATDKACFMPQPQGGYDPLDAMRRDAYREVVSWLKRAVARGKKELEESINK